MHNQTRIIYRLVKKNQFLIGVILLIFSFIIVRLPYFLYMPFPFINGDGHEYYGILNLIKYHSQIKIGFPGIGYPVFFLFCEKINNTALFAIAMQSFIQLLAVLLFYYYYKIIFKRHLIFTAVLLIGYVTSNINLYYDTAYHPDSLMGSLFIIELALLMKLLYRPSYVYFTILSFLVIGTVAVRANGIISFSLVFIYLIYMVYILKSMKFLLINSLLFCIPVLLLCTFHYLSPQYSTFNIVSFPIDETIDSNTKYKSSESKLWLTLLNLNLNRNLFPENYFGNIAVYKDTTYANYVMAYQRGYTLKINKDDDLIVSNYTDSRSAWSDINLDKCNEKKSEKDRVQFVIFKNNFKNVYKKKELMVSPPTDYHHKIMHFIGFYQMFYKTIEVNNFVFGYENRNFYEKNTRARFGNLLGSLGQMNKSNQKLYKRVYKEFYKSPKFKLNKMEEIFWNMKTSKLYRWIIHPFYKIQPVLFRNFWYPIIFILITLAAIIGLIYSKFKSRVFIFLLMCCSLNILTNLLHSFHFTFLYTRYTYQMSFIYYLIVIFIPIVIFEFRDISNKKGNLNS